MSLRELEDRQRRLNLLVERPKSNPDCSLQLDQYRLDFLVYCLLVREEIVLQREGTDLAVRY